LKDLDNVEASLLPKIYEYRETVEREDA